jgi:hypothetical protein
MDLDALALDAEQLWAEAVEMYRSGKQKIYIEKNTLAWKQWLGEREQRMENLQFVDAVAELMQKAAKDGIWPEYFEGSTPGLLLRQIAVKIGLDAEKALEGKFDVALAKALRHKHWDQLPKSNGARKWYMTPEAWASAAAGNGKEGH